jgi:hypothetical protein
LDKKGEEIIRVILIPIKTIIPSFYYSNCKPFVPQDKLSELCSISSLTWKLTRLASIMTGGKGGEKKINFLIDKDTINQ